MQNGALEGIASAILEYNISVTDNLFESETLQSLRNEALSAYNSGEFHAANIGKGIEKQRISEIRGDKVQWLNRAGASSALEIYWSFLDELRACLSDYFRVHLERTELHYAVYP